MAPSSSSSHSVTTTSSSRTYKYEVFLSFRGEDTRKTFVDHLYSSLIDRQICTYKDDQTLPRGESIRQSLFEAIEESRIAVIVFSKNYVGSSWCLDELAHIMKCKEEGELIVMPIFYNVEPSEVRNQKRKFREAFAKQEAKNVTKAESWRKALVDVCNIAGWELKNYADGHESKLIKEVVDTIFDRLFPLNYDVDEDLVGMRSRLNDLKSRLDIRSNGVRMVGIWGVGGSGKTTLAFSLYKEISYHFQGHCIVDNIRVESNKHGIKSLQEKILSNVFKTQRWVQSVDDGKDKMKSSLCKTNVLILLDDVDDLDQLQALAGSHQWFGSGSRIIITTRDEHLLKSHKVDEVYRVRLLLYDEAIQLFNRYAHNEKEHVEDYESLSLRVVSYANGLPLALKVLGSFLFDKDKNEWISALEKLKYIPDSKVMDVLKISYDGLETYQKELFLDIACFWRWKSVDDATEILEACDFHPKIGIKVLRQKALISIVDGRFDMHDLVQELGFYIVRGEHPKNPEKHSRVWNDEEIRNMCFGDATMENHKVEAIRFDCYYHDQNHNYLSSFCKIVSNMKNLRCLMVRIKKLENCVLFGLALYGKDKEYDDGSRCLPKKLRYYKEKDKEYDEAPPFLSNELRYIDWDKYPASPFPHSFQPWKLTVLKLSSEQKELWKGFKRLPHLKVLKLFDMKNLLNTPDFDGFPNLQKLIIHCCNELKEIHSSFENHTSLEYINILGCYKLHMIPRIAQMKNLKTLKIKSCHLDDGKIPYGIGELSNLQELDLSSNRFSRLDFNLSRLTRLRLLNISYCDQLLKLPELPSSLAILKADYCFSLTTIEDSHRNCKWLCQVSLINEGVSIINDGGELLQSMLEGKPTENHDMILRLGGVELAKGFRPPLLIGSRCKLQLPNKWCNNFTGFLMCVVLPHNVSCVRISITSMQQVISEMGSQEDVLWEENDKDKYTKMQPFSYNSWRHIAWWHQRYKFHEFKIQSGNYTLMWYVSFASLKQTTWWDQTYKSLSFNIEDKDKQCSGFGVRLIEKRSINDQTSTSSRDYSHYAAKLKIEDDKASALTISLSLQDQD